MKQTAAVLVVMGALAAGCGGTDVAQPVSSSSCGELLYEGEEKPELVVVSDLPRRGVAAETTKLMVEAIEFVLRDRKFRAGEYEIGYQSCNDAVGGERYDEHLCRQNARAYVAADDVVGIIGPYNSGCALEQLPIVSREAAGPLAMVSPANTFVALTRPTAGIDLDRLYPDGIRSYVRVVTHDPAQGAAAAHVAKRLGARRIAVVHQSFEDDYVKELTAAFHASARKLGLEVSAYEWPAQESYLRLARAVAGARPEAVYLAGLTEVNAQRLVEDLRRVLGPRIPLIAPDSFAAPDTARELGRAGEGLRATVPGIPLDELPPAGKRFVRQFGGARLDASLQGAQGAPEAAQAAEVLLDAIARSDGTRASVVEQLFETKVRDGILGSFSFDPNGDIVPRPVGIYRFQRGKIVSDGVVRVPLE